ncbi:MAG: pyrophosphatase [Chloroflexi bacterium]|jgi:NTP pyrophosphatase (non-canonical NTP hydrolase)|nr:pyrophosphatase [Chloroflexota bacterium]
MDTIAGIKLQIQDMKPSPEQSSTSLEQQLAFLISEVGQVAREVLNLNEAGAGDVAAIKSRLGQELYNVIWNACALADLADIDLDRAVKHKPTIKQAQLWNRG